MQFCQSCGSGPSSRHWNVSSESPENTNVAVVSCVHKSGPLEITGGVPWAWPIPETIRPAKAIARTTERRRLTLAPQE